MRKKCAVTISDKAYSDAVVAGIGEESLSPGGSIDWELYCWQLIWIQQRTDTNIFFSQFFAQKLESAERFTIIVLPEKCRKKGFVLKYKIFASVLVWKSSILIRLYNVYNVSSAWTEAVRIDESGFGPFSRHAFSGKLLLGRKNAVSL